MFTSYACTLKKNEQPPTETLFSLLTSDETGITFLNKVENGPKMNIFKYRNFYNGGGVAIGDVNNDGLSDIYMTANRKPNKLYINKGNFKFEDVSAAAGVEGNRPWSTGVVMVDINHDGLLDIYVSNAGNLKGNNHDNELFINNGDLTFTESAADYNLANSGFTTHSTFFDYDRDGDLDVYILNNSNIPITTLGYTSHRHIRARDWDVPTIFKGVGDLLLRNDEGVFTDVSEEAGIYGSLIGFGLGVYVTDLNKDAYPDIYVSNDFFERDYLYINNRDGTFTEDIKNWTSHLCLSAMGVDMADINNDGLNDIFVTDMLPEANQRIKSVMEFEGYNIFKLKQSKDFFQQYIQNTLQVNNGNNTFSETAYFSGIAKTDWSWAGLMFDMDNDGYKDIYVTNGINHDLTDIDFVDFFADEIIQKLVLTGKKEDLLSVINKMPVVKLSNYSYRNNGDLTFENITKSWGMEIPSFSNGCAYGDLDNDGDLDIVVNNVNMESFLFRNNAEKTGNSYLKLSFKGSNKNKFGIGASVSMYIGKQVIFQEMMPSRGFQSSMEYGLTVGLGKAKLIDSLHVVWPNGQSQKLTNLQVNQSITLDHSNSKIAKKLWTKDKKKLALEEIANQSLIKHEENYFNDFDYEGLIVSQLSQEGPALAIGDINGDGNEDVFVGGSKNQPGTVYIHKGDAILVATEQISLNTDKRYEDTAAAFFDSDGDGDLDLVVGSGGNEQKEQSHYISRLYLNNGTGTFTRSTSDLPSTKSNTSVIAPYDFDRDGDQDLFIGARSVPAIYGIDPDHLFLVNNGDGTFHNETERFAYDTKSAGMITGALWVDLNKDMIKDLVTVSDWGTPIIFINSGQKLTKIESSLDSLFGWWNTLETVDLDADGDMDFIFGNSGSNIPYKPSPNQPLKLWVNDFDRNGKIEQITTISDEGGDYPTHMRKEITAQLVSLKKETLKASEYAKKTIQELFNEDILAHTIIKKVTTAESVLAINDGNGNFSIKALPSRTQFSCICGIACVDVNKDGKPDIIAAGNNFELKPQYSRLDASYGNVLLNNTNLNFEWLGYDKSGFFIKEEVKHLGVFRDKNNKTYIFAAINEQKPRIFKVN